MFGIKTLFAMLSAATGGMAFGSAKTVRANRRPTGIELRDRQNPHQAARLQAAKGKRSGKAKKLDSWAARSFWGHNPQLRNAAHCPIFGASFFTADQCKGN